MMIIRMQVVNHVLLFLEWKVLQVMEMEIIVVILVQVAINQLREQDSV